MANPEVLKSAFDTATSWNEWATALVVIGLVVEFAALLLFSKDMPRREKVWLVAGSILVAVGVGGEYVFGGRAASAAKALQQASDERIAILRRDQEGDHRIAMQATKYAANLGVSLGTLHDFVVGKQREIDQQFGRFKAFAADEKKRNDAVIADLSARRSEIEKARTEAVSSASQAMKTVAAANAALDKQQAALGKVREDLNDLSSRALVVESAVARRSFSPDQRKELVTRLKAFPIRQIQINPQWDTPEVTQFSSDLADALVELIGPFWAKEDQKAPSHAAGGGVLLTSALGIGSGAEAIRPSGVTVEYVSGNSQGEGFGKELVRLLNSDGISAIATSKVSHDDRYPNPNDPWHSFVVVNVGEAPRRK